MLLSILQVGRCVFILCQARSVRVSVGYGKHLWSKNVEFWISSGLICPTFEKHKDTLLEVTEIVKREKS